MSAFNLCWSEAGIWEDVALKKNPNLLIVIGVIFLAIGGFLQFTGGPPKADAALTQACRSEMTDRGADAELIAKCDETAFASAMTATDAEAAARSISAANNAEVGGNAMSMFLLGLGLVLVIGRFVVRRAAGRTPG